MEVMIGPCGGPRKRAVCHVMDGNIKTAMCGECGEPLILGTIRISCPKCGSDRIHFGISLGDKLDLHESVSGVAQDLSLPSRKRDRLRLFSGDQRRVSHGDWVDKKRVIDRDGDRYREVVKDKTTGDNVHEIDERLSEHKGHGSDKRGVKR